MSDIDLQPLFRAPLVRQEKFPDVHTGQASDVWLVETTEESVIVRSSRMTEQPADGFWWGARELFGVQAGNGIDLAVIHRLLAEVSTIPVPQVLRTGVLDGRQYTVVERMPGTGLRSFLDLPPSAARQLGECLASIHARAFDVCGTVAGQGMLRYPPEEFLPRMVAVMRGLVERYNAEDVELVRWLEPMCDLAARLSPPESASLILLDMDPTQFLSDGVRLTALVDTELYALGPRDLDLIAMEYLLDEERARAFAAGYEQVLAMPDLRFVRPVYRYLYRLMEVQGRVDIRRWMEWPAGF